MLSFCCQGPATLPYKCTEEDNGAGTVPIHIQTHTHTRTQTHTHKHKHKHIHIGTRFDWMCDVDIYMQTHTRETRARAHTHTHTHTHTLSTHTHTLSTHTHTHTFMYTIYRYPIVTGLVMWIWRRERQHILKSQQPSLFIRKSHHREYFREFVDLATGESTNTQEFSYSVLSIVPLYKDLCEFREFLAGVLEK